MLMPLLAGAEVHCFHQFEKSCFNFVSEERTLDILLIYRQPNCTDVKNAVWNNIVGKFRLMYLLLGSNNSVVWSRYAMYQVLSTYFL